MAVVAVVRLWQFFSRLPITAPFQFDYEEGNILNALLRITQGATPYPDPHALPSIINPYGPAAYYLLAVPVKVFGLAFVYPRAMIVGCAVAIAVLVAIELRRATKSIILAVSCGLVLLTIPNILEWAWMLRVDLLGIMFTAAGLVVFTRRVDDKASIVLPGVLFATALLVKPTLIAAPAACFLALMARRNLRDAAKLTGVTAAAFGCVIAIFAVTTRGAALTDIFFSHPDPFSFRVYTQGLTQMLTMSWPLVGLAIMGMARGFARREFAPALLWLPLATVTAITAGKLGSNANHFLEWNVALCLAAGIGLQECAKISSRTLAWCATALAVVATALVISRQPDFLGNVNAEKGCPKAYEWVRTQAGPNLLSENVGALVLGGKKVWVSNPFVLAQLVERAGWSDDELVRMVRERRFDAIFTRMNYPGFADYLIHGHERFSPALLHAIGENYDFESGFDCRDMNILYRPKPAIQSNQVHGR